jgi:hypothetical protein
MHLVCVHNYLLPQLGACLRVFPVTGRVQYTKAGRYMALCQVVVERCTSISLFRGSQNCYLQARTDAGPDRTDVLCVLSLGLARNQPAGKRNRVETFTLTRRRLGGAAVAKAIEC